MKTWLTSDEHMGHSNIIQYSNRPYKDVEEMNKDLIARHNSVVGSEDIVWHLGDFSLSEKIVPEILKQLNGKEHRLVMGNHDRCHPCRGNKSIEATKRYLEYGFTEVVREARIGPFLANHLPYIPKEIDDKYDVRFPKYRPEDKGDWLLHGHIHQHWKQRGKMINVGVDVWDYTPVLLDKLIKIKDEAK